MILAPEDLARLRIGFLPQQDVLQVAANANGVFMHVAVAAVWVFPALRVVSTSTLASRLLDSTVSCWMSFLFAFSESSLSALCNVRKFVRFSAVKGLVHIIVQLCGWTPDSSLTSSRYGSSLLSSSRPCLAHDADARPYFKFLFIFVLYTLAMTLFDSFPQWGITILLSALMVLYQMTLVAFSVHLDVIPLVLAVVTVALSVEIWQNHALEKAMSNTADISETVYIHETRIIENMCVDD
ncbi:hypothetical protein C8J56DRAFT_1066021 [Mycena floridula]|nr:hypothetical protein C8J56DRAFT_1066021 [Mycena floridula]